MGKSTIATLVNAVATGLGKGIIAGVAGTAAITLSQLCEMKITNRQPSTVPADAASKVLDIIPATEEGKRKFAEEVHWTYGICWGLARAIISATGLKGWPATIVHFTAVWGTAMIIEPKLKVAPPVAEWDAKTIAIDGMHHAVYATAAGITYDLLDQ